MCCRREATTIMTKLINTQNTGNEEKSSRTRTFGRQKGRSGHPFRDKGEVTRHTTHGFENDQHPSSVWSQLSVPDYRIGVWTGQEHNKSIRETAHALSLTQEVSVAKALSCTAVNSTKTGAMSYKMDEKVVKGTFTNRSEWCSNNTGFWAGYPLWMITKC